jgi:undecaprenyl-diphosphatase
MNEIISICAKYLIFVSILYASFYVITTQGRKRFLRHAVVIFGSAVGAWVVAHFLKNMIAHPRPDALKALFTADDPYSFPSGHATFMFALASAVHCFHSRQAKVLFILALVTGIARVLAGVHYWYDTVGGAVLGSLVASFVYMFAKKFLK